MKEANKWAKNLVTLARRVGITYSTLKYFRKLDGFPAPREDGLWNIAATKRFIASRAQRLGLKGMPLSPIEQARLNLLSIKNQRAEFQLSVERGEVLPKETVRQYVSGHCTRMKDGLYKFFRNELPPSCEGCPEKRIEKLIRNRLAEILMDFLQPFPVNA
jgi:hypothetical protein